MHGDVNSWLLWDDLDNVWGTEKGVLPFNEHRFITYVVSFCRIRFLVVRESQFGHGILNFH